MFFQTFDAVHIERKEPDVNGVLGDSGAAPDGGGRPVNAKRPAARRITETAARAAATVSEPRVKIEPVVDATFVSVCATVLLSLLITAAILAMGTQRPVPVYAVVGSALFGTVFGSFLMAALHLAITDSKRHHEAGDDH